VPVRCVSLEFATESLDKIQRCIEHLTKLQPVEGQISTGESMAWTLPAWIGPEQTIAALHDLRARDPMVWGDVYIRRAGAGAAQPE